MPLTINEEGNMSIARERQAPYIWIRASACAADTCVEVAPFAAGVAVRDSKDTDGPILRLATPAWHAYLQAAKNGELDHLAL